jgi:hypothetical protein
MPETFPLLRCCMASERENVAMTDNAAYRFYAILNKLRCNPVLTAMMVTSLIFGLTASIASIEVWRASSACVAEISAPSDIAQVATDVAYRSDLQMDEALHADVDGGLAHSRKAASAACPCSASIGWRWQRI